MYQARTAEIYLLWVSESLPMKQIDHMSACCNVTSTCEHCAYRSKTIHVPHCSGYSPAVGQSSLTPVNSPVLQLRQAAGSWNVSTPVREAPACTSCRRHCRVLR